MAKSTALTISPADALAQARAALRADLDDLRDRVADLKAERQSVASAPCDREEAENRIDGIIKAAQSSDLFDRPELFRPDGYQLGLYFTGTLRDKPLEVLATIAPEQLKAALLGHHPGGGISSDKRGARLEELDRDLRAAEIAEEIAIREFEEATGGTIPRRLDADPAILLAPDNELWRTA